MEFRIIFDAEIRRLVETRQNFFALGSRTTSPLLFDEKNVKKDAALLESINRR